MIPAAFASHFADQLETHGDRIALTGNDGRPVTYADLARRADAFAQDLRQVLGRDRGLLLVEMRNTPEAVTAYLGALRARWPVILGSDGAGAPGKDLVSRFGPDLIWRQEGGLVTGAAEGQPEGESADLHAELGVMLSTSGSTGSTKLVRLSRSNLHENARSIAEYLELDPDRVTATTLPLHYSYGLSVLNSFLLAGARLVLTEASVIDAGFRPLLDQEKVTDLAGVPYTYELFERLGLRDDPPESLRTLTQAGGRLPPETVSRYARFGRERGVKFFVMYGQTEATARMAYLPPELALDHADCIGVAIPRGTFRIQAEDGSEITKPGQPGELIYQGPNVMMGYGLVRGDLARGPELDRLATGDIAELAPGGLYRIVGRTSRFSKIAGLRIGFDEVEAILRRQGIEAVVTGDDRTLLLAIRQGDPEAARQAVSLACGIPVAPIFAWPLKELPVLSSGKTDYVMLRETGFALASEARAAEARSGAGRKSVAALYAHAMNRARPAGTESFSGLGGDSLAYVAVSIGIEEMLGTPPANWESMPIAELQALADSYALVETAQETRKKPRLTLNSDVVLRLAAISLIFIGHGAPNHTEFLRGGSGVLFALAGYSMAMIQLPQFAQGRVLPFIRGTAERLVLPYLLMVTVLLLLTSATKSATWYLLYSTFVLSPTERGPLFSYWFVESLIHSMLLICGLFLIPWFRRQMVLRPYPVMIALVLLAAVLRWVGRSWWPNGNEINLTFDGWLWMFFLGWAAFFAISSWQKVLVVILALGLGIEQFGPESGRPWWLFVAMVVLLVIPSIRIPQRIGRILVYMAGATYFMYLWHPLVTTLIRFRFGKHFNEIETVVLVYVLSILVGLIAAEVWRRVFAMIRRV